MRLGCFVWLLGCSFLLHASDDKARQETQLRIQPVGQVSVKNENNASKNSVKKELGKDTYEQYCTVCHRDGLAGAPKFRNENDWQARLINKKIEDLVASSIKGLNAMPSKGTCIKCSDADLKAAITYMLPTS